MSEVEAVIQPEVTAPVEQTIANDAAAAPAEVVTDPNPAADTAPITQQPFDTEGHLKNTFGLGTEELKAQLEERRQLAERLSKQQELNDYEQKLLNAHRGGISIAQFERLQKLDVNNLGNEAAIIEKIKLEDPGASEAEIRVRMKVDYGVGIEEGDIDPDDLILRQAKLRKDGPEAKKALAAHKAETLAKADPETQRQQAAQKQQKDAEAIQQFRGNWESNVGKLETLTVDVSGTDKFAYKVSPEALKTVNEAGIYRHEQNGVSRTFIDDAKFGGPEKLAQILAAGLEINKITSAVANDVRSKTQKETEDKFNNNQPLNGGGGGGTQAGKTMSPIEAMRLARQS